MGKRTTRPKEKRLQVRRRLLVERLGDRRVLAAITGAVFDDLNHSLVKDDNESNVPHRLVYLDANDNGALDTGESFAIAESDGTFAIPNVSDGTYLLRLFNGATSQRQTFPIEATPAASKVSVLDALQLQVSQGDSLALTSESLVVGNLQTGESEVIAVGNELAKMQTLPDGRVLVVGTDISGDSSWIVDPQSSTVTPVDLADGESMAWSEVAIDDNGRGVLLDQSGTEATVRSIDATNGASQLQVTETAITVPSDTQVLTSGTSSRSVFAWSGNDGLQVSLWSNLTDSFITNQPFDAMGATDLLAFDDDSGLLVLRTSSGGVSVHDVNGNFGALHTFDETGPVAIDGARDLLMTVSPVDAMLKLINLRTGALVADLAVDLSSIGQVASIAVDDSSDSAVILGAAGVTEVALRKPAAHEITISGGSDPDPVSFGVALSGENSAPEYTAPLTFVTNEDQPLTLPSPAALNQSSDADGDQYVVLQLSQAALGSATVGVTGAFNYSPIDNVNGSDSVVVQLHDGRDLSVKTTLLVNISPTPDPPTGIVVAADPVPEHIQPGESFGTVEVIDADGANDPNNIVSVDDPRFEVNNGELIFVGGDIDFETEPVITITVMAEDTQSEEVTEEIFDLFVEDQNDPITGILPITASVEENDVAASITFLEVIDEDDQEHSLTVDDDRFVVEEGELRLADGVALDYEQETTVVVSVTATEIPDGGTFTQAITIHVQDIPEQPVSIELSNLTVTEFVMGDVVGEVTVDGREPLDRFALTVDDSRFEIVDGTLKLTDDVMVDRATQAEIELTITASDSGVQFEAISETFVIEVLENLAPFHNTDLPFDVDHGGDVTALDAMLIINYLNAFGPGPVGQGDAGYSYDVNADGLVTALDAMLVINEFNRLHDTGGTVSENEGEGEQTQGGESSVTPNDATSPETSAAPLDSPTAVLPPTIPSPAPRQSPASDRTDRVTDTPGGQSDAVVSGSDTAETSRRDSQVEIPTHESSDAFVESVDETLRLLADDDLE